MDYETTEAQRATASVGSVASMGGGAAVAAPTDRGDKRASGGGVRKNKYGNL
jgi:hypothetical protein